MSPTRAATADSNLDGNLDIALNGSKIDVRLADGRGGFKDSENFFPGFASLPTGLAAADLNGGKKPDLVVSHGSGSVWPHGVTISFGRGNRKFTLHGLIRTNSLQPRFVLVADFDGDKKDDILLAFFNERRLGFLPGLGSGYFGAVRLSTVRLGSVWNRKWVGDMNGDGRLDASFGDSILLGNGKGDFTAAAGGNYVSAYIADIDGDGKQDVLCMWTTITSGTWLHADGVGRQRGGTVFHDDAELAGDRPSLLLAGLGRRLRRVPGPHRFDALLSTTQ
ncbi:MAG: FG-GAP repeat domain-containing protein [Planctomycetota bacterium]